MEIKTWLHNLNSFGDFNLLLIFLLENLVLLILSVIVGLILEYKNTVYPTKDSKWLLSTLICNTLITFVGFKLYIFNFLGLIFDKTILSISLDLVLLTITMDFLMFIFHFCIHKIKWIYTIHKHHHSHVETNVYSLYVLHPIETLGFGFIWLFCLFLIDYNFYSVTIYLILNLTYAILGHLKVDVFPKFWYKNVITKWISTTKFHNCHHKNENKNFGFYFTFWDKIFKTYQ
jgi:sterol desaturase/sphingolipid hydroxylase (fatty acid hydroxylase superfamily)